MRYLLCSLLATFSLATVESSGAEGAGTFVLEAARIYPSPDGKPIDDGVILFREGRILAVGARNEVQVPAGAQSAQCAAGVVMAGFQNSHVHFTGPQWTEAAKQSADELSAQLAAMLTRYGFTTVVDTGSPPESTLALRGRIESGEIPGPRILTAGIPLYPEDGIPIYLRDMPADLLARMPQPATPEEARQAVRANLDFGADATKLFVATPQGGDKLAYMSREAASAAAQESHARGRPVLAHPSNSEGVQIAIDSGVDVLVHTTIEDIPAVWAPQQIADMLAHKMAVVPTLKLWPYEMKRSRASPKAIEAALSDAVEQVRAYARAGGQVLFGTDVGYMTEYDPTDEYVFMSRALSAMQILESLTTAPAARWGEGGRRGRIAPGMDADLVVLGADPAQDASRFADVSCTFRKGRAIYFRSEPASP